jgi:hypothetical protein
LITIQFYTLSQAGLRLGGERVSRKRVAAA